MSETITLRDVPSGAAPATDAAAKAKAAADAAIREAAEPTPEERRARALKRVELRAARGLSPDAPSVGIDPSTHTPETAKKAEAIKLEEEAARKAKAEAASKPVARGAVGAAATAETTAMGRIVRFLGGKIFGPVLSAAPEAYDSATSFAKGDNRQGTISAAGAVGTAAGGSAVMAAAAAAGVAIPAVGAAAAAAPIAVGAAVVAAAIGVSMAGNYLFKKGAEYFMGPEKPTQAGPTDAKSQAEALAKKAAAAAAAPVVGAANQAEDLIKKMQATSQSAASEVKNTAAGLAAAVTAWAEAGGNANDKERTDAIQGAGAQYAVALMAQQRALGKELKPEAASALADAFITQTKAEQDYRIAIDKLVKAGENQTEDQIKAVAKAGEKLFAVHKATHPKLSQEQAMKEVNEMGSQFATAARVKFAAGAAGAAMAAAGASAGAHDHAHDDAPVPARTPIGEKDAYVVKSGDTFGELASQLQQGRYKVPAGMDAETHKWGLVEIIASLSGITDINKIKAGQILIMPTEEQLKTGFDSLMGNVAKNGIIGYSDVNGVSPEKLVKLRTPATEASAPSAQHTHG